MSGILAIDNIYCQLRILSIGGLPNRMASPVQRKKCRSDDNDQPNQNAAALDRGRQGSGKTHLHRSTRTQHEQFVGEPVFGNKSVAIFSTAWELS
jgi:hypothetical protein